MEADSIVPCNLGKAQNHSLNSTAQNIGKDNEKYNVYEILILENKHEDKLFTSFCKSTEVSGQGSHQEYAKH